MLSLAHLVACTGAATTLDLGGDAWQLTNSSMAVPVAATVPGQVHTDLFAAGVIADPYNGTNDQALRWVALADWEYSRSFDVPADLLSKRSVQLLSLGIDTVASIYLNGKHVFDTDNMFHRIRLDIKSHLVAGTNHLRVAFTSKVNEAAARAAACDNATSLTCPSGLRNPVQHGFDNQNYLRTEPCSFSCASSAHRTRDPQPAPAC